MIRNYALSHHRNFSRIRVYLIIYSIILISLPVPYAHGVNECTVTDARIDFGSYHPIARRDHDMTGSVTVLCRTSRLVSIALSPGSSGRLNPRKMGPSGSMLYNLYTDANRRIVWGDGIAEGSQTINGHVQGGIPKTFLVYGRITGGQNVPTGQPYNDRLTVSVTW